MRPTILAAALVLVGNVCHSAELSRDQRLIVACHRLDVEGVASALRQGANVNARFGEADDEEALFDRWELSWSMASENWTPLLAVAHSSEFPDPPRKIANTAEDRDWAKQAKEKIPAEQREARRRAMTTIALMLLSHKADVDLDDGYGATALYMAIDDEKVELAKLLLRFNAKVNTKTGVYIDGPADTTPLHCALRSPELTKLLLEKGADRSAKTSDGETPLDWARRAGNQAVIRLYEAK